MEEKNNNSIKYYKITKIKMKLFKKKFLNENK